MPFRRPHRQTTYPFPVSVPLAANAGLISEAWHGSLTAGGVLIEAVVQQQNGEDVVWIGRF